MTRKVKKTSEKTRINLIAFLNSFTGVSGGDTRFAEIMKRLCEKNAVDLTVVTSKMGKSFCEERGLNAVFKITTQEDKVENKVDFLLLLFLKRILNSLRLNLKIENSAILYSAYQFLPDVLPVYIFKHKANARCVQTLYHLLPPPTQRDGPFLRNLFAYTEQQISFAFIKRYADLIIVLNSTVKNQLVRLGFSEARIHVIGAGVDVAQINRVKPRADAHYDACFLGRLHPSKGIFDLPEIWQLVVSRKKDARLAVIYVGSKKMENVFAAVVDQKNLGSNITMLPISGEDALSIVKSSDVFVFPSHEEGWGIAICEAMACGLPVVAYDLPAYKEIYRQGIVKISLKNIRSFSNEVVNLLQNDKERRTLGEKGRLQVKMYDWNIVAARELLQIRKVLS